MATTRTIQNHWKCDGYVINITNFYIMEILKKIKKVLKFRHCLICHREFPWEKREHKCRGVYVVAGECHKCNPENGRGNCPMCGSVLV